MMFASGDRAPSEPKLEVETVPSQLDSDLLDSSGKEKAAGMDKCGCVSHLRWQHLDQSFDFSMDELQLVLFGPDTSFLKSFLQKRGCKGQ